MNAFLTIIIVIQVLAALSIIGLVLLQHGKGADMGAAFGSGASGSLFGATGASNFLSKSTGVAAAIFFASTMALSYIATNRHPVASGGLMDNLPVAPAKPSSSAALGAVSAAASAAASVAPSAAAAASAASPNQIPK